MAVLWIGAKVVLAAYEPGFQGCYAVFESEPGRPPLESKRYTRAGGKRVLGDYCGFLRLICGPRLPVPPNRHNRYKDPIFSHVGRFLLEFRYPDYSNCLVFCQWRVGGDYCWSSGIPRQPSERTGRLS